MTENPQLIIARSDHYEVHFEKRVEFWDKMSSKKVGESKVHCYRNNGKLEEDEDVDEE
jgi:hypothetical protein